MSACCLFVRHRVCVKQSSSQLPAGATTRSCFYWRVSGVPAFLLIKIGVETVPPITLTLSRLVIGAVVLCSIAFAFKEGLPKTAGHWFIAAFVGIVGNALPFTLIHWGEQTIDSGLAALFMGVMPVWVVVLAHFFADERMTLIRTLGVISAFTGLLFLVGWDVLKELGDDVLAQTAVIAAAICYAISTIFVRRQGTIPMRPIAAASLIVGALVLLPIALLIEAPDIHQFSTKSLLAVGLLGLLQTGLAALLYFHLIARVGATVFSQINYIIPILGIGWGVLLLNEQPGWREALALGFVLVGLILVNRRRA